VLTADRPPLPAGHYYHHELLGCTIVDEKRGSIGTLAEILLTGANDVYVVQTTTGREVLLPAIAGVVLHIDIDKRVIQSAFPMELSTMRHRCSAHTTGAIDPRSHSANDARINATGSAFNLVRESVGSAPCLVGSFRRRWATGRDPEELAAGLGQKRWPPGALREDVDLDLLWRRAEAGCEHPDI
jgi:hypothetical protein